MSLSLRLVFVLASCTQAFASPQFLFDIGSVHDEPLDGTGDSLNGNLEFLSLSATAEDRALREFYAGEFVGSPIQSATVAGTITATDLTDVGSRVLDFYVYSANGNVSASDFSAPALFLGSASYHPPAQPTLSYQFDATGVVATLLSQGSAFLGLRVECATSPSPGNSLDTSTAVFGITGLVSQGPFCFGDGGFGPGCTDCPCGNTAPPVAVPGGCLNSSGTFGKLFGNGVASVSADTLGFVMDGASPGTFAILASGDNRLPSNPANPCFGSGSGVQANSLDGLRCVGANIRRHGTRATDAFGSTLVGWGYFGGGPPQGLVAQGGFAAGTQRHFQCTYRENAALVCQTGLNTSNGVTVTIVP